MNSEVGCSRCTAVAALQLVGEDRLALDSPITSIVDLGGTTISAEVTLRHLLTHTSGLADDADEEAGEEYETLWVASRSTPSSRHATSCRNSPTSRRFSRPVAMSVLQRGIPPR